LSNTLSPSFGKCSMGVGLAIPRNNTLQLQHSHARLLWRDSRESGSALAWSPVFLKVTRRPLLHPGQQQRGTTSLRFYFNSRKVIPAEGAANVAATTVPIEKGSNTNWKRFAWYFKMARLPFLIGAIYGLGYQQGVMETVRNPTKMQESFFESMCMEMGVASWDDVDIICERQFRVKPRGWLKGLVTTSPSYQDTERKHQPRTENVANIGREIIRAARQHVREELNKAMEKVKEENKKNDKLTELELLGLINADETVTQWSKAQIRIEGEAWNGIENWQYVLVGTPIPNAFVSELLPQRFFVTTGLFEEFVRNDDELAMILGHEISHLILGHLSESNQVEFWFRGLELFILALDPTEGMMSLGVAGFLARTRDSLLAAFSREHESDADELGCQLAARACFDTKKGSQVFLRMHEYEMKNGQATKDIMASHPPSKERFDQLVKQSEDENLTKYSHCHRLQNRVVRALTLAPR
jgi:Zn-dependent protease with chaperone function